jgi:uncharacterized protein with HEPN domain
MDLETFAADTKAIKAVELDLIIIGEAASHISPEVQRDHPQIPWNLMRAMRNRLVHVYFSVDPRIIWDTIRNDLPPLAQSLQSVLDQSEHDNTMG